MVDNDIRASRATARSSVAPKPSRSTSQSTASTIVVTAFVSVAVFDSAERGAEGSTSEAQRWGQR
jgi:hypothetical protein